MAVKQLRRDAAAAAVGLFLAVAVVAAAVALAGLLGRAQCSGEYSPFLGSGAQTFAIHGCLAKNAGPLIDIKKRLGIYDPAWKPVIK